MAWTKGRQRFSLDERDSGRLLGGAIAGIHSMTDEHFGISIVEYMAAVTIPIEMDIVLAEDREANWISCPKCGRICRCHFKIRMWKPRDLRWLRLQ
ncbi:unnamed protein product [Ilex paraguariensis]|uniref:Uncharacterized protein n=1 Tax=Ilex paraguariensis TaxID=185542 RepID=A0ABC8T9J0_9AQUA